METASDYIVNVIRASTRPVLTFILVFSCIMFWWNEIPVNPTHLWLAVGSTVWWFGDRTYFKTKAIKEVK